MRNKVNYLKKKIEERTRIEKLICYLGLDYLFVGIVNRVMRPPTMSTIIILWNREFNYYKEQPLDSMMVKHELKSGTSSRTNQMKSKTKDTTMGIQLTLLNQIHFPTCMYITMWRAMKEQHTQMIGVRLDEFYRLNWNTINHLVIKEIICSFQVSNEGNIIHRK